MPHAASQAPTGMVTFDDVRGTLCPEWMSSRHCNTACTHLTKRLVVAPAVLRTRSHGRAHTYTPSAARGEVVSKVRQLIQKGKSNLQASFRGASPCICTWARLP